MIKAEPGSKLIVTKHVFNAPPAQVFQAYVDAELIPQWWGPRCYTVTVEKMEAHKGGAWRFLSRDAQGHTDAFSGVIREIFPPRRLVMTFIYEAMPGHEMLNTVEFEKLSGGTRVTETMEFQSVEDRDGMLNSGMEEGSRESIERLMELLK